MPTKRRILVLFNIFLILSLSCGPLGQAAATQSVGQKKASPASPSTAAASKTPSTPQVTPASENTVVTLAIPGVYPAELTEPFPVPLPLSGSTTDDNAAILAKAVLADDQDSFAALLAAFQESGIAIRSADGGKLRGLLW